MHDDDVGFEKQWRWVCPECEAPLLYQCRQYEDKPKKDAAAATTATGTIGGDNKYLLYAYPAGLIRSVGECRVAEEVARMNAKAPVGQAQQSITESK